MTIDIKIPALGESVTEATVGRWLKKPGDAVKADEPLVELETDKVSVEVPAPAAGVLGEIKIPEGTTVAVGTVIGSIKEGVAGVTATVAATPKTASTAVPGPTLAPTAVKSGMAPAPSARKILEEKGIAAADVQGSGKRGQILKGDALAASAPQWGEGSH